MAVGSNQRRRRRGGARRDRSPGTVLWSDTKRRISNGNLTPFVSASISNGLIFGAGFQQLVDEWAKDIGFPEEGRKNVASVAQYSLMLNDASAAKSEYLDFMLDALLEKAENDANVSEKQRRKVEERWDQADHYSFTQMVQDLGYLNLEEQPDHPLSILATLPLPIYITTCYHQFLEVALERVAHKEPESEIYPWNTELKKMHEAQELSSIFQRQPDFRPSARRPLVYHLFGRDDLPASLVLTENDHLDYLKDVTRELSQTVVGGNVSAQGDLIARALPAQVADTLTQSSLLLLGYDLLHWDFRVLFRGLVTPKTATRRDTGICIQFRRDGHEDEAAIKQSLQDYLLAESKLKVYWGKPEDCMQELQSLWKPRR